MQTHRKILAITLFLFSSFSHATLLTFKASGEITSAPRTGAITAGDLFDIYYTFDSTSPDTNPSETRGDYELHSIDLKINTYNAETRNGISGLITVDNSGIIGARDHYTLNSSSPFGFYSHAAPLIGDRELIAIVIQYMDTDATVFSSDALPLTPLDINNFESAQLDLLFSNDWQYNVAFDALRVYGEISSITKVPEPATLALFGLGLAGLGLARRKKA